MTRRLYYENPYLRDFSAQVLSCAPKGEHWQVVLDKTAFYPEGGGQPCDIGTLGGAEVLEVHDHGGEIVHLCDKPLSGQVSGQLNWQHRFSLMQQHSGEHLVSGLVHNRFGFENVGFHMGAACMTIDFSGIVSADELSQIERAANEAVWADLETEIFVPSAEELCKLTYRSKKALTGDVRLVRFPGIDTCACCGTHVRRTGEIGQIILLSCVRFREGVRVELLCGEQAYVYSRTVRQQNHAVSALLSTKPFETAAAATRLQEELNQVNFTLVGLQQRLFTRIAQTHAGERQVLLFEPGLNPDALRRLTAELIEVCSGLCAVFSGSDTEGYKYAIGQKGGELRQFTAAMNTALCGRGGGKPFFVQGSVTAAQAEIAAFFAAYEKLP